MRYREAVEEALHKKGRNESADGLSLGHLVKRYNAFSHPPIFTSIQLMRVYIISASLIILLTFSDSSYGQLVKFNPIDRAKELAREANNEVESRICEAREAAEAAERRLQEAAAEAAREAQKAAETSRLLIQQEASKVEDFLEKEAEDMKRRGKQLLPDPIQEAKRIAEEIDRTIDDPQSGVVALVEEANRTHEIEKQFGPLNEAVRIVAKKAHEALQAIPIPEEAKAALTPQAALDWAQIQAYVRVTRRFGEKAQPKSQAGQTRYIEFLRQWLTSNGLPIAPPVEADALAAGVPAIPEVDRAAVDIKARSADLAAPGYPWHSPPNGAGTHQLEVPNSFLASGKNAREIFIQHDKDYQSPGVERSVADDKLENALKALFHKTYPGLEKVYR